MAGLVPATTLETDSSADVSLTLNERTRFMLALIAPAVLALVLFQVVPIVVGANTSFRDWSLHDPKRTWVGFANYAHVLGDPEFLRVVLPNTFGFMIASVACSLVLGLAGRLDAEPAIPRARDRPILRAAAADGRARHRGHNDPLDVQRSVRRRERGARRVWALRRSAG